jgi:histidine triad (HIT) family protein
MTREAAHCTFCDLIHGAAEVSICHEDADAIAFMDIQPVNNGHVLVVPREHFESLLDVPQELGIHLFKVTMRLANAITAVSGCHDLNIVVNSGAAAGQDEPHFHVHIIPRRQGDGFDIPLPFDGSSMPDRTVLDAYAARIIVALREPARASAEAAKPLRKDSHQEQVAEIERFDEITVEPSSDASAVTESGGRRRAEHWRINEGAHGELRYEPVVDKDTSV